MVRALARAKVNLALHVTGRQSDGYHLLDSLVIFADAGDGVSAEAASGLSLKVEGRFAGNLPKTEDNLVMRAAQLVQPPWQGAAITLSKALPVSSGLGSGSADAAATLRCLTQVWGVPMPPAAALVSLGADVPVCVANRAARVTGIGETVRTLELPPLWLLLANDGRPVSTTEVFKALKSRNNEALPPVPDRPTAAELLTWLAKTRNDLQEPALSLQPGIAQVQSALASLDGAGFARMSGAGGTCFALFTSQAKAKAGRDRLKAEHPDWWVLSAAAV